MKNIIQFVVTKEQGVYTADGVNVPVVTQGSTVALFFLDENAASLGFSTSPAILTNFELAPALYEPVSS
jgi:hypothetical protein